MSKIKQADFYYGAVLSMLLNNKITPAIVESNNDRQIYDLTTDHGEFRLYTKYRKDKINIKTQDYNSWQFVFSDNEINELKDYLNSSYNLVIALECGAKDLNDSEIAVLDKEQVKELSTLDKESITISRKKNERYYRISIGGGRDNAMQVKYNRFEEIFVKNKEADEEI